MIRRLIRYLQEVGYRVDFSAYYLCKLRAAIRDSEDRAGLPKPKLHKLPLCWLRGHDYQGDAFVIVPWRLQFCRCCNEEIGGRASWEGVPVRDPDDADWDWLDREDEAFGSEP